MDGGGGKSDTGFSADGAVAAVDFAAAFGGEGIGEGGGVFDVAAVAVAVVGGRFGLRHC